MIPVEVVTPNADGEVVHEVKAGQTLWQIAISYETKIDELKRLNNLYDNSIYPGERLLIRQGVIAATSTPIEPAILEVVASETTPPTQTATLESSVPTATQPSTPISFSTNQIMSVAIGIIILAVLSVLFVLSDPKKPKSKTKE